MLSARNLSVRFGSTVALRDVSIEITAGARIGIVGESGSGKSLLAQCLMGMPPETAELDGLVSVDSCDMTRATEADWRKRRARKIAMIFQEPMTALNPLRRVGDTVMEPLRVLRGMPLCEARSRTISLFKEVDLPDPERRLRLYPHELSGGQRQRVLIALALACNPEVLIADEPTTALDAEVAMRITNLLVRLSHSRSMALVMISHDLSVIARATESVHVMFRGEVVEHGSTRHTLQSPRHPYTTALLAARPKPMLFERAPGQSRPRLPTISETMATLAEPIEGSRSAVPHPTDKPNALRHRGDRSPKAQGPGKDHSRRPAPILEVSGVKRAYRLPRIKLLGPRRILTAVSGTDLTIAPGETLGIVGESGSGKSTLARMIMGFEKPDGGKVLFDGRDIHRMKSRDLRAIKPRFQMVFQDPYGSLNPRHSVGWSLEEPLRIAGRHDRPTRLHLVSETLEQVGLRPRDAQKFPHEFSGGQRQRIAIARAIVTRPDLIVADEPVSALDVSVQAQILNLLMDLQDGLGLAMLFISHDLAVVGAICDRVMVMKHGNVVEAGATAQILANPAHDHTRTLLESTDLSLIKTKNTHRDASA